MFDILIKNGTIYDGSGRKPYCADIAIIGDSIAEIGKFSEVEADTIIDAAGKAVTPGFIDMHSHADLSINQYPDAESVLGQGITTSFCGHCGMGMAPVGKYWKTQGDDVFALEDFEPLASAGNIPGRTPACLTENMRTAYKKYFGVGIDWTTFGEFANHLRVKGTGVNLVLEVGLQQIRQQVLGLDSDRPATETEIVEMKRLVCEAMDSGAFGLSIGYDYTPDLSASQEELDALAQCVKSYDGIVAAHTRNGKDDDPNWEPMDGMREFLDMGLRTGARVHISHIHQGCNMGLAEREAVTNSDLEVLALVDAYRSKGVDVSWDVLHPGAASFFYYPELCSALLYYILQCGGKTAFAAGLADAKYCSQLIEKMEKREKIVFPPLQYDVPIVRCKNERYIGKTVRSLAECASCTCEKMLLEILRVDIDTYIRPVLPCERTKDENGLIDVLKPFWIREDATIGTDNAAMNYDYEGMRPDLPHFRSTPAAYHGFVRFLMESESEGIPFEKTIQKVTGNAAGILRLNDRGTLQVGNKADVLVIDSERLATNEDFIDPRQQPSGLDYVIVNGKIAVDHGKHTHVRSGEVINYRDQIMTNGRKSKVI